MEIPLSVSLTPGGGGTVSAVPFPFPRFSPGTDVILRITGAAALQEIRLVVGRDPVPVVKLTVLDQNGVVLVWRDGSQGADIASASIDGANIEPPPPPPGGVRVIVT